MYRSHLRNNPNYPKLLMLFGSWCVLFPLWFVLAIATGLDFVVSLLWGWEVAMEWLKVGELPSWFDWTYVLPSVPSHLEKYMGIHIPWVGLRYLLDSVPALAALLFITMFSFLSMDSVTNRLHDLAMKLEDEEYEEINWTDPKD